MEEPMVDQKVGVVDNCIQHAKERLNEQMTRSRAITMILHLNSKK